MPILVQAVIYHNCWINRVAPLTPTWYVKRITWLKLVNLFALQPISTQYVTISSRNKSSPRDCKVSQAAYPMYISCTFKMRFIFFSFSIGGSNLDPGDLGNYRSQTKISNTKVAYINFPCILTPVLLRLFVSEIWPKTRLTFRWPTTLTFDLKFWK